MRWPPCASARLDQTASLACATHYHLAATATQRELLRDLEQALSFSDTLLRAALLSGMSFCKSTLQNLDFADADLTHTDFRDAIFEGGSLAHARIFGAKFAGADLRGADLSGFELNDAKRFKGATISRAQAAMFLAELGVAVI